LTKIIEKIEAVDEFGDPVPADKNMLFDAFKELCRMRSAAQECAKDAAWYVHPRLSAMAVDMNIRNKKQVDPNRPTPTIQDAQALYREMVKSC